MNFIACCCFYRDRAGAGKQSETSSLDRLLVVGEQLDKARVTEIAEETFGVRLKPLAAGDVGLMIPSGDLDFDAIAAPRRAGPLGLVDTRYARCERAASERFRQHAGSVRT